MLDIQAKALWFHQVMGINGLDSHHFGRVQLQTIEVIKFTDQFFGTLKSIGIGR